jgi:trimethylguanosine synthase
LYAGWCGASESVIVDAFAGAGGNTVQFAVRHRVVAIDIHWERLALACSNASVYHVHDRIEFICANFFVVAPQLKVMP